MTQTTFTWQSESATVDAFSQGLQATLAKLPNSIIILSCSANSYDESEVNALLTQVDIPVCGGVYPHIFLGEQLFETGVIFVGLPFVASIAEVYGHHIDNKQLSEFIESNSALISASSTLMFYDALMANTELFMEELHSELDREMVVAGGGAGNLDFIQRPCVYTNQGLQANTIQLVLLPVPLKTGIGHGWQILDGPYLVSEASGSLIESLNYQNALEVYKETVEKLSDYSFAKQEFFEIAKQFPFGIESINNELLVRDPIVTENQCIQCVGNVPINAMVYILKGEADLLVDSARQAVAAANESCDCQVAIVFDCISRKMYLEDSFKQELHALAGENKAPLTFGVLSLGEIANDSGGAIKLLNKSTVIGCF